MTQNRLEHDLLGEREVPGDRYYGIQTLRALENFNMTGIPISSFVFSKLVGGKYTRTPFRVTQ